MDQDTNSSAKKKVQREYMSNFIAHVDSEFQGCGHWINFLWFPTKTKMLKSAINENAIVDGVIPSVKEIKHIIDEKRIIYLGVVLQSIIHAVSFCFGVIFEDKSTVTFKIALAGLVVWAITLASTIYYWFYHQKWTRHSQNLHYVLIVIMLSPLQIILFSLSTQMHVAFKVLILRSAGAIPIVSGRHNLWSLVARLISDLGFVVVFISPSAEEYSTANKLPQVAASLVLIAIALAFNEFNLKAISSITSMQASLLHKTLDMALDKMSSLYFFENLPQYTLEVKEQNAAILHQMTRKKRVVKFPAKKKQFAKLDPLDVVLYYLV